MNRSPSATLCFRLEQALECSAPVREHQFSLRCSPVSDPCQRILHSTVQITPQAVLTESRDAFGNRLLTGSLIEPHSGFNYICSGRAVVDRSRSDTTPAHPALRHPGRLTEPGPLLKAFYKSLPLQGLSSREAAELLSRAVSELLTYAPGSTHIGTTAEQALAAQKGVCQDYAHIFTVLCRLHGLPARYCAGLTVGEGATHAWAEVLLPEGWQGYDPTRRCPVDNDYLVLAKGRDFEDCPLERGHWSGLCDQTQTVFAQVWQA